MRARCCWARRIGPGWWTAWHHAFNRRSRRMSSIRWRRWSDSGYLPSLGYEGLNDHKTLRHDPLMAELAGKSGGLRRGGGQVEVEPTRIVEAGAVALPQDQLRSGGGGPSVRRSVSRGASDAHGQITLDLDATDDPLHGEQEGRFFPGYYLLLPAAVYFLRAASAFAPSCAGPASTPARARLKRWRGSLRRSTSVGLRYVFCCGWIPVSDRVSLS